MPVRSRVPSLIAAGALAAGALTAVGAATTPAAAGCPEVGDVYYSTPYEGVKVWIPTSDYSDWVKNGGIRRTISEGRSTTTAKASSHSITATGEIGAGWGPISAKVTTTYNGKWSKKTSTTTSIRKTWSYSFHTPEPRGTYRARAYKVGWRFKYRQTRIVAPCNTQVTWLYAFAPLASNTGTIRWNLEKYANRNKYRYDF